MEYAPNSHFSSHVHTGGEEFLVLEGVFQDEHGDFPAGSYIRNPPQSSHTPRSEPGCQIFVKLWQFDLKDRTHVRIDTNKMPYIDSPGRPGVAVMPLFKDGHEDVRMERYDAKASVRVGDAGGAELLVVDGSFEFEGEVFMPQSWLRLPKDDMVDLAVGDTGATVWVKSGHLADTPTAPAVA